MKTFLLIFIIIEYFYLKYTLSDNSPKPLYRMNIGTTLFTELDISKQCWTRDNVALLSSRRSFQNLLPPEDDIDITNEDYIHHMIDYFLLVLENIRNSSCGQTKHILLLALSDTLGGYMNHFLLPVTRYSYYCGFISYDSVQQLYRLFNELKLFLKTNGYGWNPPGDFKIYKNTKIPEYEISQKCDDPCGNIIFYKDKSEMIIPLPYFDSKEKPVAMAVPLKTSPVRNIESKHGVLLLVKYYDIAIQCLESKGNQSLQALSAFKKQLIPFLKQEVLPKLCDEKFYSAFGGVYRILQDLQCLNCAKKKNGMGFKTTGQNEIESNSKKPFSFGFKDLKIPKGKIIPDNLNFRFIAIVVAIAALIWLSIGLVYCLIFFRSKGKRSKKNKEYIRFYTDKDPSTNKARNTKNRVESSEIKLSNRIQRSINKIRRIFPGSNINRDADSTCNKKNKTAHGKKVSILTGNYQHSEKFAMPNKSCKDVIQQKSQLTLDESDTSPRSNCGTSSQSSNSIKYPQISTQKCDCQKSTQDLKSVSFSISSKQSSPEPENVGSTSSSKESANRGKNYGTCNQVISEESKPLSAYPSKTECMQFSKTQLKHSAFKYNFKYDLENATSSSESSPGDPIWPYTVTNCRIKEKRKTSMLKRNN